MFRTIMLRGDVARNILRKSVRTKIVRNISIECAKKRHCHRLNLFGETQNQVLTKWNNKEENLRFYSSELPKHLKVPLPALSPTMDTGTLISWEKKEGDKLNEGDLLAEIETDKATMGFETPEEGYLAKIIVPGGTKDVPLGKLICIIVDNKDDVAAFKDFKDDSPVATPAAKAPSAPSAPAAPVAPPPEPQSAPIDGSLMAKRLAERKNLRQQAASPSPAPVSTSGSRVYASPLAKRLAAEKNIPLEGKGTGLYGSITSTDLSAQTAAAAAAKVSAGVSSTYNDVPVTNMRATIAKRLLQSKTTVPHYYLNVQVNVDQLVQVRTRFNKKLEKSGVKLSLNDFVIKAVAMASIKVPDANSAWLGTTIRKYKNVDVSVAVSTERGLITPIVFEADKKGIVEISKTVKVLAAKAREGKLQPSEFQGGTISVSNLGMFGVDSFAAIINPPQSCILAVGTTNKKLLPDPESEKGFKVSEFLSVTLSSDHRTVDGAVGAQWLKAFKECLEDPVSMII